MALNEPKVQKFKDFTDILWKLGYLAGIVAVLYLRSTFVTKEQFDAQIKPMEKALIILIEQQKQSDRLNQSINELELRIRALERAQ